MKKAVIFLSLTWFSLSSMAQEVRGAEAPLPVRIKVQALEGSEMLPSGALPSVFKNKIYKGKKAHLTNLIESTQVSEAHNTRQVLQESSGVIVSDVNNQSYYSIGIRGVGDPHESQGLLLMSDDIPLSADPYGYPAAYYLPPMTSVESIEVTKTGAGLLYGSQPGGSLNYRLKQPSYHSDLAFQTTNTFGSNELITSFNVVQGGTEKLAYRFEAYQRTGAGQFENNSGFAAYGIDARFRYKISEDQEIKPQLSYYKGRFEEPGGLALTPAAGRISIKESVKRNTLQNDELLIDRVEARVSHEYKAEDTLSLNSTVWASNLSRESRRQNGSGFGVIPTNNSNTIQDQDFYSAGARLSLAKDYKINDNDNTLTTSLAYYKINSPIEIGTGLTADADQFAVLNKQLERSTESAAFAVENIFSFGAWTLTPAFRVENIKQNINEEFNGTASLRNTNVVDDVLLGGLAVTYTTENDQQLYANISEGFRPVQFSETVPTSSNTIVNDDLNSSKTLSTEIGIKGLLSHIDYDFSAFQVIYKNQVGTVTGLVNTSLGNVGEGLYQGFDMSFRGELSAAVSAFANSQFLSARYVAGAQDTKTPAYAPGYLHKFGVQHTAKNFKSRLSSTIAGEHYSDDNNTTERVIPAYHVWDFSGEYTPKMRYLGGQAKILYGINNLLDEKYYSRVRATGIEPALERNYYAGFELAY